MRLKSIGLYFLVPFISILPVSAVLAQVNITTWQGSLQHTGLNSDETLLSPGLVGSPGNFGLLYTQQTDGQTYGQPLYMSSATLNTLPGSFPDGKQHNVVYIATQSGSLYAFDADADPQGANPSGTNSSPIWHTSLIPSGSAPITQADVASSDILGNLAVTTTPVIDPSTSTIYVVSTVKESPRNSALPAISLRARSEDRRNKDESADHQCHLSRNSASNQKRRKGSSNRSSRRDSLLSLA